MTSAKKLSDENLYFGSKYLDYNTYFHSGDELISALYRQTPKILKNGTINSKWIMARGFFFGEVQGTRHQSIIFSYRDEDDHQAKLLINDLYNFDDQTEPQITLENLSRHAFSNFAHKIIIFDINGDKFNDLLVAAPTSSWLDLPAVGHAEIFLNCQSFPFFNDNPIIVRGNPIALSYFGFSVVSAADLNGDHFEDFLVSALKVYENDDVGRIYVFFGGKENTLKHQKFFEIIIPRPRENNGIPRYGFSINVDSFDHQIMTRNFTRIRNTYITISRLFDSEVDIYKRNSFSQMKVDLTISPDHVVIDEEFVKNLMSRRSIPLTIQICIYLDSSTQNFFIPISFKDQYRFYSFHPVSIKDTLISFTRVQNSACTNHILYLLPWLEEIPSKLILRAQIYPVKAFDGTDANLGSYLEKELFSEIKFEKRCGGNECVQNYTLTLLKEPIFVPNTNIPIIFDFKLTNHGDFLTHFIIEADISLPCNLNIIDHETHRFYKGFETSGFFSDSNHSFVRAMYPLVTEHDDYIIFYVEAVCVQPFNRKNEPKLNLKIISLLPYGQKCFTFNAIVETEFSITQHRGKDYRSELPDEVIEVCWAVPTEFSIEFTFKFSSDIRYKDQMLLVAVLGTFDTIDAKVISVDIHASIGSEKANTCVDVSMRDKDFNTKYLSAKEFLIKKTCIEDDIQFSYTAKIHLRTVKVIPFFIFMKSRNEIDQEYKDEAIMNIEAEHYLVISPKACSTAIIILCFVALAVPTVVSAIMWSIFCNYKKGVIKVRNIVTYVVDNSAPPQE